jgi:hypothetical protein
MRTSTCRVCGYDELTAWLDGGLCAACQVTEDRALRRRVHARRAPWIAGVRG